MAQMYKVFINNKSIIFTKNLEDFNNEKVLDAKGMSPSQLLQLLKQESVEREEKQIVVNLKSIEFPHREFVFLFKEKIAAGGLVVNERKELLMILRNGEWDLPKGHQDGGESIEECAIREVEEECGIGNLEIIAPLQTTYHHYLLNEKDILKETFWFLMQTDSDQALTPQAKEGIEKVEWTDLETAQNRLENSWISLLEVLDSYIKL
jgi:8-oxo-dGTP pyrophosphatase MutT (NUDIX family)